MRVLLAFGLMLAARVSGAEVLPPVSIIDLISNPDVYHGKEVRVIGFGEFNENGQVICLHQDDVDYGLVKNCIRASIDESVVQKAYSLSYSYVDLTGVFSANKPGHIYPNSGMIKNVTQMYRWPVEPSEK